MKYILVTGGAGYIGSHTVIELIDAGYEPVILDDFSNATPESFARLEKLCNRSLILSRGACTDAAHVRKLFKTYPFEGVIHFAAFKAVGESVDHPEKYYHNNLVGLLTILNALEEYKVRKLVFSSSCTVYGIPKEGGSVFEETPLGIPNSPYGWTKFMGEQMIRDFVAKGNIDAVLLRYFNPIGAHPSGMIGELPIGVPNNIVPFITQTASGIRKQLIVFGEDYNTEDGTCIRDYIHVCDLAKAHIAALKSPMNQNPEIYNLGTGKGTSVLELIAAFEAATGKPLNWRFGPRRVGDVPEIFANADKAKKDLNWSAKYTVNEALVDAWRWEQNRLNT